MRPSSARRAAFEPYGALVAVVVVALALATAAGAFEAAIPTPVDRNVAEPTADRVERALTVAGVVRPGRLPGVNRTGPEGYRTNVTLTISGTMTPDWTLTANGTSMPGGTPTTNRTRHAAGPSAPTTADHATRRVGVRLGPGDVRPGRLEVRVWT